MTSTVTSKKGKPLQQAYVTVLDTFIVNVKDQFGNNSRAIPPSITFSVRRKLKKRSREKQKNRDKR